VTIPDNLMKPNQKSFSQMSGKLQKKLPFFIAHQNYDDLCHNMYAHVAISICTINLIVILSVVYNNIIIIIITRAGSHITKYISQCGKLIYYYTIHTLKISSY